MEEGEGHGIVVVESGSAILRISSNGVSAPVTLEPGSFASIPSGVHVRLRSADRNPVSVVIYFVTRIGASDVPLPAGGPAPQVARAILWSGPYYWSQSPTMHRPARIVLPVGSVIELTSTPNTDLLLGGDTGMIEIGKTGGSVVVLGEDRWPVISEGIVQLDASHAASVNGDGTVFVRNMSDTPVTLVLISIEQVPISESPLSKE